MTQRTVKDVKIVDIQKRKLPSKHYVYVISVTWSDRSVNVIYRRYSKFFDLQTKLLEEFPEEGGVQDPTKRTLPFLPGKIIFGRSHVRDVALRRMEPISGYCKDLISLGNKVSNSSTVIKFFEPLPEDIELPPLEKDKKKKERETVDQISGPVQLDQYVAIADYRKQNSNELNMVAGDIAEVIDKNENGWWFVNLDEEQGWVPAAYLESLDGNVDEPHSQPVTSEERFITTSAYKAELDDEMSFEIGVIVTVLEKNFDGWWLVRYQDREGWAPAMYLRKPDPSQLQALKHGCPSLKKDNAAIRATSPAAVKIPQLQQLRKDDTFETKSRKLPPRKSSVKRSLKKLPVHINNMSYEQTMVGEVPVPHAAPEVEYFTVGDFRSLGIEGTLDFAEGASVDVVEKAPNGWWLGRIAGKEGWIPSSYLGKREKERKTESTASPSELRKSKLTPSDSAKAGPPAYSKISEKSIRPLPGVPDEMEEKYVTVVDFEDDSESSISFKEGEIAELIQRDEGGWSFVRIRGKEGWAPTSYLVPKKDERSAVPPRPKPPVGSKPSPPGRPKVLATPGAKRFQNTAGSVNKPQTENSTKVLLDKPTVSQSSISKKLDPPVRPQVKSRSKPVLPVKPVRAKPSSEHPQSLCVAIASYSPGEDEGMAFSTGEEFHFLEDSGSGWWLVKRKNGEEGWAPAAYLEKRSQKPSAPERLEKPSHPKKDLKLPTYIAVAAFSDDDGDDFARFKEGDRMEVLEMDEGGWWLVKVAGKSGWAPSNFLKPCE